MDAVLEKLERLAEMASREAAPAPLDAGSVMARIRGLEMEESEVIPFGLLAGGVAAAAAVAVAITAFAVTVWTDLSDPLTTFESLYEPAAEALGMFL